VRNWSLELDLLGVLNIKSERKDPKWQFKTQQKQILIDNMINGLTDLFPSLNIKLDEPLKKLVYDDARIIRKVKEKPKTRLNWFAI